MSPEAVSGVAVLVRLQLELRVDLAAMGQHQQRLSELQGRWDTASLEQVWVGWAALSLHAWYTALETLSERIVTAIDRLKPEGPQWHTNLLAQAATAVPKHRPALIPVSALDGLRDLRKFRHFFRSAYVVLFDPVLVERQMAVLLSLHPAITASIADFDSFLTQTIESLQSM